METRSISKLKNRIISLFAASLLLLTMGAGTAFAATYNGPSFSFSGNSGFSYSGYASLQTGSMTANAYQYVKCTSTAAPINNMRAIARLTDRNYYPYVSGNWVQNGSTYGAGSYLVANTGWRQMTPTQTVCSSGYSGCWKNYAWYDLGGSISPAVTFSTNEPAADEIGTNESGLTFGNLASAEEGMDIDLVKVWATNGELGYVYYDQLIEEEGYNVLPDDAEAYLTEKCQQSAEALQLALSNHLNTENRSASTSEFFVSFDDAEAYLTAYRDLLSSGDQLSENALLEGIVDSKSTSPMNASGVTVDERMLYSALCDATESMTVYLPVYSEDGTTIIGRYPIGSLF